MNHARLYRNELTLIGYGNPVWEPNPDTLYDRIRIGDVGYFQNEKFVPLFNILPPDDSTRSRRLPFPQPDFPAVDLPPDYPISHNTNPLQPGVYALESSLTFSASVGVNSTGSVLHGESSLSFTNEKGAALILPYEASREDTLYDELFKKHMLKYYRQWYTFALTECHRNIKLYDLILVTGCDMTRQWATATYFRHNREMSAALGAQVAPVAEAKFSLSAGWRTTQAVNTRRGPPQALHQQTRLDYEGTQNDSELESVNNQCIFLRGFYVKDRLWGPQVMKAGAGYHDPGKYGPEEEGAEGVLADEDVTVEALLPSTQGQRFMTVLLDYMLEESDADVVIANDSDLRPYLEEVENPENLRDTLKRMPPRIEVEDGVGSLIMKNIEAGESAKKELERRGTEVPGGTFVDSSSPILRHEQRPSVQNKWVANTTKRVPMACINCRRKKLKCRKPDEIQRDCPRCIEAGIPCEYVPISTDSTPDPAGPFGMARSSSHAPIYRVLPSSVQWPPAPFYPPTNYYQQSGNTRPKSGDQQQG